MWVRLGGPSRTIKDVSIQSLGRLQPARGVLAGGRVRPPRGRESTQLPQSSRRKRAPRGLSGRSGGVRCRTEGHRRASRMTAPPGSPAGTGIAAHPGEAALVNATVPKGEQRPLDDTPPSPVAPGEEDVPTRERLERPLQKTKPPGTTRGASSFCRPEPGDQYMSPPMPRGPPGMSAFSFSGISRTIASVVSIRAAMLAAFCKAVRVTLVGSMIPASNMSTHLPV